MPRPRKTPPKLLTGRSRDFLEIVLPATAAGRLDAVCQYGNHASFKPSGRMGAWAHAASGSRSDRLKAMELLVQAGANIDVLLSKGYTRYQDDKTSLLFHGCQFQNISTDQNSTKKNHLVKNGSPPANSLDTNAVQKEPI